ncbi:MAG: response regulator transcription factor [candidate division KSB1 bacterium]
MKVKILLVEDQRFMREGFRALVKDEAELEVVGEADTGKEAIEKALTLEPHVVVMDITLRDSELNGTQITRKIKAARPEIKVLALSQWEDGPSIKGMIAAGASGYLSKSCSVEELCEAIAAVMQGKPYFSAEVNAAVQEEFMNLTQSSSRRAPNALSPREVDILRRAALGENAKTIAEALGLSSKTVDAHRRNLMKKLGIDNLADLIKYALRNKIIEEGE